MTLASIQSPIMVIGAGRSGSTLISRMLNAHSAIDFKGETSFLLLRLWVELWHDRFWLNWPRHVATGPRRAADGLPSMPDGELSAERARVGVLVAELLVRLLRVDREHHRVWGYKELWSGLPQYNHDWRAYDGVFPDARWVHLVRHPFDFARSCADWNGTLMTIEYLGARLSNWVSILNCHRQRQVTGRYHEMRFEDLSRDPHATLAPALDALGLDWQPAMAAVLGNKTMASNHAHENDTTSLTSDDAESLIETIPGLAGAMDSCGYLPPQHTPISAYTREESSVDLRDPEGESKDSFPPRYALEAHLHSARASLSELTGLFPEDALDSQAAADTNLLDIFRQARSILAQLNDALRQ
jgi:hypothetical protein